MPADARRPRALDSDVGHLLVLPEVAGLPTPGPCPAVPWHAEKEVCVCMGVGRGSAGSARRGSWCRE